MDHVYLYIEYISICIIYIYYIHDLNIALLIHIGLYHLNSSDRLYNPKNIRYQFNRLSYMIYNPLGIHYCMIDNTDIDLLDPSPYRAPWAPNRRQRQPSPAPTNAWLRPAPRTLALGGVGKTYVIHMEYVYIRATPGLCPGVAA